MSAEWTTSVTELLSFLQQALVALVPIAEKARIPWQDGQAYDDWDAIAGCLYDNLVVKTISCAVESGPDLELPKYDMVYPTYQGAYIQVEGDGIPPDVIAVFVGFAGTSTTFARVKWVGMHASGEVPEAKPYYAPYDACKFYLVQVKDMEKKKTHALTIAE